MHFFLAIHSCFKSKILNHYQNVRLIEIQIGTQEREYDNLPSSLLNRLVHWQIIRGNRARDLISYIDSVCRCGRAVQEEIKHHSS